MPYVFIIYRLVSDIGGQLGLWVGISIITLTEVIELVLDILRFLLPSRSKKNKQRHPNNSNNKHNTVPSSTAITSSNNRIGSSRKLKNNRSNTTFVKPENCNGAYATLMSQDGVDPYPEGKADRGFIGNNSPNRYMMTYSPRPPPLDSTDGLSGKNNKKLFKSRSKHFSWFSIIMIFFFFVILFFFLKLLSSICNLFII